MTTMKKLMLTAVLVLVHVCAMFVSGKLEDFSWSQHEVHGVYKTEDDSMGIKFTSREDFLQVTTLDDTVMVYANSVHEVNKRMVRSINVLGSEYVQHLQDDDDGSHLDGLIDNDTISFNDAVQDLLQMEEVYILEDASRAVGEQGVTGKNTPAAMPFFMFTLKVTRLLDSSKQPYGYTTNEMSENALPREKRSIWCYRYIYNYQCRGLCGRRCSCWSWVCGDCCYHLGCYGHDVCCDIRGFFHHRCLFPFGFTCNGVYRC